MDTRNHFPYHDTLDGEYYELFFELVPIDRDQRLERIEEELENCMNQHKKRFDYEPHFEIYKCWNQGNDFSLVKTEYFDATDRIRHPQSYQNLPTLF